MTISVILPNYNHAHYISSALDAILSQSYPAAEIIIIDDCSTDESVVIVSEYQKQHPQIHLHIHPSNLGPLAAVNQGIKMAQGEFLAFCSADDRVLPGFFEESLKAISQHPEAAICCSSPTFFYHQKEQKLITEHFAESLCVINPLEIKKWIAQKGFWIATHTSIYRKTLVDECGGLKGKLHMISDWILSHQIAFQAPIIYLPKTLAAMRVESNSYSAVINNRKKQRKAVYQYLLKWLRQFENIQLRQAFQKSTLFGHLGRPFIRLLCSQPIDWDLLFPIVWEKSKKLFRVRENS